MRKLAIIEGQNLFDVALQEYGAAHHFTKILEDNPTLNHNSNVGAGSTILIDDTFVGEEDISAKFQADISMGRWPVNFTDKEDGDYNDDYNNDFDI